jgi:hypothetical protein
MTKPSGADAGFAGVAIAGIAMSDALNTKTRHDINSVRTKSSKRATT